MITGLDVQSQARGYLGVPFRHQGRTVTGLDCIGLLVRVVQDLGLAVQDKTDYSMTPNPHQMKSELDKYLEPVPFAALRPGCVMWLKFIREPQHIAIFTDVGMIHSYNRIGRVVEHSIDSVWKRRVVECYKIAGVCYE